MRARARHEGRAGAGPRPPPASPSVPRQAEATGGDDVALDLAGAAVDGGRDVREMALLHDPVVDGAPGVWLKGAAWADEVHAEVRDALSELGREDLDD